MFTKIIESDMKAFFNNLGTVENVIGAATTLEQTKKSKTSDYKQVSVGEIAFSALSFYCCYKTAMSSLKVVGSILTGASAYAVITHAFFAVLYHDLFKMSSNLAWYSQKCGDTTVASVFKAFAKACLIPQEEASKNKSLKPTSGYGLGRVKAEIENIQISVENTVRDVGSLLKQGGRQATKAALLKLIQDTMFQDTIGEYFWKKSSTYLVNGLEVAIPFAVNLIKKAQASLASQE